MTRASAGPLRSAGTCLFCMTFTLEYATTSASVLPLISCAPRARWFAGLSLGVCVLDVLLPASQGLRHLHSRGSPKTGALSSGTAASSAVAFALRTPLRAAARSSNGHLPRSPGQAPEEDATGRHDLLIRSDNGLRRAHEDAIRRDFTSARSSTLSSGSRSSIGSAGWTTSRLRRTTHRRADHPASVKIRCAPSRHQVRPLAYLGSTGPRFTTRWSRSASSWRRRRSLSSSNIIFGLIAAARRIAPCAPLERARWPCLAAELAVPRRR